MFFNRSRRDRYPRETANTWLNRIVTYGLVFFLLYALYTTDTKPIRSADNQAEINYTPVSFGNYLRVKDLSTGKENYYDIDDDRRLKLESAKLGYELEFVPKQSCDIIVDKSLVVSFPDQR